MNSGKDHGYAWVVLAAVFILQTVCMGIPFSSGVLTVAFKDEYNSTISEAAWVGSISTGLTIGAGPAAAVLNNRLGNRATTLLGSTMSICGLLFSGFTTQLWGAYVTYGVIAGTGAALVILPSATMLAYYFDERLLFAYGIMGAASGTGHLLFPVIEQALLDAVGLQVCLFSLAAISLVQIPAALLLRKPPNTSPSERKTRLGGSFELKKNELHLGSRPDKGVKSNNIVTERESHTNTTDLSESAWSEFGEACSASSYGHSHDKGNGEDYQSAEEPNSKTALVSGPQNQRQLDRFKSLLRQWDFWLYAIKNLFLAAGSNTVFILLSDYVIDVLGATPADGALLLTIIGVAMLVGEAALAALGLHVNVRVDWVFGIFAVVYVVSTALVPLMPTYWSVMGCVVVLGFGLGLSLAVGFPLTEALYGTERINEAVGISMLVQGVGLLAGPPLTGFIGDTAGYEWSFYAGAIISGFGVILTICALSRSPINRVCCKGTSL